VYAVVVHDAAPVDEQQAAIVGIQREVVSAGNFDPEVHPVIDGEPLEAVCHPGDAFEPASQRHVEGKRADNARRRALFELLQQVLQPRRVFRNVVDGAAKHAGHALGRAEVVGGMLAVLDRARGWRKQKGERN
jgi:hypothetical protein